MSQTILPKMITDACKVLICDLILREHNAVLARVPGVHPRLGRTSGFVLAVLDPAADEIADEVHAILIKHGLLDPKTRN